MVSIKSFVSDQTVKKTGNRNFLPPKSKLKWRESIEEDDFWDILRRRRKENIEGSIGFGLRSNTEFLANRFRDVFSGSSVLIILRQFVIKTFVPLYFFNKCRDVIRAACRHFEARTWTRSKQSSASWDMSQRFCRFYRLNPVSIKNKRSLESHFRSSLSQG